MTDNEFNNESEAPEWVRIIMERLDDLHREMDELEKSQNPQKFSFPEAIRDWIAAKDAEKSASEAMDDTYNAKRRTDEKGWPTQKPKSEVPDELLDRVREIARQKRKNIQDLMGGDDQ
ncbi:MAG: hypothetical protein PHD61_05645 [Bacteroidales bacterium]|nr:hypothetical protein [Lentimicrobiaceae bacterium]MDD5694769.1 hypothetical protein [Bacteroidales bacterium]